VNVGPDAPAQAYTYIEQAGQYAQFWNSDAYPYSPCWETTSSWEGDKNLGHAVVLPDYPWVVVPLVPESHDVPKTTGTTDAEFAFDGKLDTYATLSNGGSLVAAIPKVSPIGRIAGNSFDSGTDDNWELDQGAPAGLAVEFTLCRPDGFSAPEAGYVLVYILFPSSEYHIWKDWVGTAHFEELQVPYRNTLTVRVPVPYMVGSTRYWAGSKWHNWEFSNSLRDEPPNEAMYNSQCNTEDQFLMRIVNATGIPLAVMSMVWTVGCKLNVKAHQDGRGGLIKWRVPTGVEGKTEERSVWALSNPHTSDSTLHPFEMALVGRGAGRAVDFNNLREPHPSISNVYVSRGGLRNSALISGSDAIALYIMEHYEGITDFVTAPGLGQWSRAAALSTLGWTASALSNIDTDFIVDTRRRTSNMLADLDAQTPGGFKILRRRDGMYGAHVWFPGGTDGIWWGNNRWRYTGPAAPSGLVSARDHVVTSQEGLQFEVSGGDVSSVINEIVVDYDQDTRTGQFRRVAMCNAEESENGYGFGVGNLPESSGTSAPDVCAWSQARYGGPRHAHLSAPGVRNPIIASALARYHLSRYYRPPITLRMTCTEAVYDMEPGHYFRMSNSLQDDFGFIPMLWGANWQWEEIWWLCTGAQRLEEGARFITITAEWAPLQIANELTGGGKFTGGDQITDFDDLGVM